MRYLLMSVLLMGCVGTAEAQTPGPAGPGIAYGQSIPWNPGIALAPPTPFSPPIAEGPAYSPGAALGPPMTGYGTPGLMPYGMPVIPAPSPYGHYGEELLQDYQPFSSEELFGLEERP